MSKHTPGPWRWEFNGKHRQLTLVGGRPRFDLTIMEFCRWGMWGAGVSMRDTVPEADGFNLMYKVHERPDWIKSFKGRDHHKDWCAAVDHPDMRLMQAAPDMLEALEALINETDPFQLNTGEPWCRVRAAIAKAKGNQP
jgi:hypothetical protein